MITKNDWDVLVVGAGPAGSRAAAAASSKGLAVLLIDAKARIGEQPHCGEFVHAELFDKFNLDKSCWIQQVDKAETFILDWDACGNRGPKSAPIISKAAEMPMGGVTIDRPRFDRDLARMAACSGATVMSSTRFLRRENDAWIVRSGSGEAAIRARIVIAADGARSRVAAEMGIEPPELATGLQVEVPVPRPTGTISIFLSRAFYGGYGWLFPKGKVANVGVGITPSPAMSLTRLLDAFLEVLSSLGMIRSGKLAVYAGAIPASGIRDTLVKENVIFCGDAGGFTDPLTGSGISPAVTSGGQAGEAAANAVKTGTDLPLRDYERAMTAAYGDSQQQALATRKDMMARWDDPDFENTCRKTWLLSMGSVDSGVTLSSYLRDGR